MRRRGLGEPAFLVALAMLAVCAAGMSAAITRMGFYLEKKRIEAPGGRRVASLPIETASWVRRPPIDRTETEEVEKVLGTANYVTRTYVQKNPAPDAPTHELEFHVAYYTGMIDTVPHVPDVCFVGGGMQMAQNAVVLPLPLSTAKWTPDESEDLPERLRGRIERARTYNEFGAPTGWVRLPVDPRGIRLRVTSFLLPGTEKELYAGYFFIANGGTVANAGEVRLLAFELTMDYAYYLKVQFTSTTARSPQELAALGASLLDELLPDMMKCVPDWVEVELGRYPEDNPRGAGRS